MNVLAACNCTLYFWPLRWFIVARVMGLVPQTNTDSMSRHDQWDILFNFDCNCVTNVMNNKILIISE